MKLGLKSASSVYTFRYIYKVELNWKTFSDHLQIQKLLNLSPYLTPYTIIQKWIIGLNIKLLTVKLLENREDTLGDLEIGSFLKCNTSP